MFMRTFFAIGDSIAYFFLRDQTSRNRLVMARHQAQIFSLTRTQRYAIAVSGVLLAAFLRALLDPFLGADMPLFVFVAPVIAAGWFGGLWPGLLSTVLSLLIADYLFIAPRGSLFQYEDLLSLQRIFIFAFVGTLVSILCDKTRNAIKARVECLERFEILVDSVPDFAIFATDPQGRITCWNTGAERLTGYSEREIIGRDFLVFCAPENILPCKAGHELEIARTTGRCEQEGWQTRKDGSRFWASGVIATLRNDAGEVCGFAKVVRDTTGRKQADENNRFMVNLSQALVPLAVPEQMMAVVMRMLAEYLDVDCAGYANVEADEDHFVIMGEYARGETRRRIGGRHRISDFGERQRQSLLKGRPYVVNDIVAESPKGTDLLLYRRDGIQSMVVAPLIKDRTLVAEIAVHQNTPRVWLNEEIDLITTVANRCWESVERARALKRLKESDDRYRAFISNSSEGIWRYELDEPVPVTLPEDEQIDLFYKHGYFAECNEVFARTHGRSSMDEILGERLTVLLVRSEPEKIIEYSRAFVRSGYRLIGAETREVDIYGNSRYFLSNLIGIQEDGRLVRAWGTQRDITAQKRSEEALRINEERMRRITDATQDALWEIDLKTKQLWWSEAARPLFGHSPSELQIGLADWYNGIHPEDRERVHSKFETFMSIDGMIDWSDEYRFLRADGVYIYIHDQGRKFCNAIGEPVLVAGAMVDITERKAAEQALRESEERFAKAFRASPDALVISRIADAVILEVNDSFVALTGHDRKQLIGKSMLALDIYVDPDIRGRALKILEEKGRVRDIKVEIKRRSGEVRLLQFSAEPLDLRGEHCWLNIGRDITEQDRAEKDREQLLVKEKAARQEAETSNRMKDEFVATISHELRTPLAAILGWAHMLARGTLSESQTRHAVEVIRRSAQSQARLVDDILDTSRIITGRFSLEAKPIDIAGVFQAAIEIIRPSAEAKGLTLQVGINDPGSIVLGDANRIQQIIWNLLSNAVKFTDEGGRIDARLTRVRNRIEISINDTGIGIETEFLPHVFERFRQEDSTSTRKYGGVGLGLAIVRHLAEVHGGSASASSPGKGLGSTFKVNFPVARTAPLEQPAGRTPEVNAKHPSEGVPAAGPQRLNGMRVLVVEDDPETLDMLKFVLGQSEAEVTTATSVTEALQTLERSPVNVIVSDLAMRDQDGYDLIRQIRTRAPERGGNIPAIALSAYTRPEDRTRAVAAGFQLHLPKPIDPGDLVAALARLTGPEHVLRNPPKGGIAA